MRGKRFKGLGWLGGNKIEAERNRMGDLHRHLEHAVPRLSPRLVEAEYVYLI